MKNGKYKVSFIVDLNDCDDEQEGFEAVMELCTEAIDGGEFPVLEFELLEDHEPDYVLDEVLLPEVNFG